MSSITKIALVGATGNLGPAILKGLLDANYHVTILSREGSKSTDSVASHPNQSIAKVNFDDVTSISSALQGIQGVVSNVASHALLSQKKIIDAAITAGVQRFIPSDFGSDFSVASTHKVPFLAPKQEIHEYLESQVKSHPGFSYTYVTNGPFFDWCLRAGIFGDLKNHEMTLWDGGATPLSTTTLPSIGKAVAGVFRNAEATKNREVRIADTTISQNQIIEIVKELDGKEWTTRPASTAEAYQAALDELKKPHPDMQFAVMNQLFRIIFSDEFGPDLRGRLDNDLFGLEEMTPEQVKQVVKSALA